MRNYTVRSQEAWPGSGSGEEDPAQALLVWTPALADGGDIRLREL